MVESPAPCFAWLLIRQLVPAFSYSFVRQPRRWISGTSDPVMTRLQGLGCPFAQRAGLVRMGSVNLNPAHSRLAVR